MENYQSIYISNLISIVVLFVTWIFAAVTVSSLVRRKTGKGLRLTARLSLLALVAITGLIIWRGALLSQLAGASLELLATNFLVSFIFLLPPLIMAFLWGGPPLWKIAATAPGPNPSEPRVELAAPEIAVPFQMGLVGAGLALFIQQAAPSITLMVLCGVAWLAFGAWAWWRQSIFSQRIEQNGVKAIPRFWPRFARRGGVVLAFVAALGLVAGTALATSRLPDRYSMNMMPDGQPMVMAPGAKMLNVNELTGPRDGTPDKKFTLVAQKAQVKLASGQTVEAWTYNGQLPGPELRVKLGDLVEVTLQNKDIAEGVTIHWHGVKVPNAEDGVAGMTQDAVRPGQSFVYRFRATETGTYWYHSHQVSDDAVKKGLFGAFIVDPASAAPGEANDMTILSHTWPTNSGSVLAFGPASLERKTVAPGSEVRLRLINTDNGARDFSLTGTTFRVASIDGADLNQPGDLDRARLVLAAGGRYDLRFTMPNGPVLLNSGGANLFLSADGQGEIVPAKTISDFNPASYGKSTGGTVTLDSHFDREYTFDLEGGLGFYNGGFNTIWLINGQTFPNTPPLVVREGDLVKITFVNRTVQNHPMHPHGHKMLVLSRNGQPVSGSPWWSDTLNVAPGEIITVALKADNPGLWMDHCHNLDHASAGMVMHLMYDNVMTPYEVGPATPNNPE